MNDAIFALNVGSSSIKYGLYHLGNGNALISKGEISAIGANPVLELYDASKSKTTARVDEPLPSDHGELIRWLVEWIAQEYSHWTIAAAGHRIAHGGPEHAQPALLTPKILERLTALCPLAPDHQPFNLAGVRHVAERWPDIPQIACFDTAFHRTLPRIAQLYALPREFSDAGVIRYGFHGLSYQYIAEDLPNHAGPRAEGRVIAAHLGSGASMCAMVGGNSRATSMGFTALDGLVMGRRCGDIDPGVILHLMRERNMQADAIEDLLGRQSGLLGVSGVSSDMRTLLKSVDPHAKEAIDLFVYRAAREIGSLAAAMGGLEILVFTGGIGENSTEIRARIGSACAWLGVRIDAQKNDAGCVRISADDGGVDVFAIPTDEEKVIARGVNQVILSQISRRPERRAAHGDSLA